MRTVFLHRRIRDDVRLGSLKYPHAAGAYRAEIARVGCVGPDQAFDIGVECVEQDKFVAALAGTDRAGVIARGKIGDRTGNIDLRYALQGHCDGFKFFTTCG